MILPFRLQTVNRTPYAVIPSGFLFKPQSRHKYEIANSTLTCNGPGSNSKNKELRRTPDGSGPTGGSPSIPFPSK